MTAKTQSAQDDLAYMRTVVEQGGRPRMAGALIYMAAGLIYGTETLVHWGQSINLIRLSMPATLTFVAGCSALFVLVMIVLIARDKTKGIGAGSGSRALNAAFGGAGLANIALMVIFGVNASRQHDMLIWMLYPCVVFALQGAAWYVAFMLRRKGWMLVVSLGCLVTAALMGMVINTPTFNLVAALACFAWLAVPGAIMARDARREA
jgi:PPE-repeat protein